HSYLSIVVWLYATDEFLNLNRPVVSFGDSGALIKNVRKKVAYLLATHIQHQRRFQRFASLTVSFFNLFSEGKGLRPGFLAGFFLHGIEFGEGFLAEALDFFVLLAGVVEGGARFGQVGCHLSAHVVAALELYAGVGTGDEDGN